MSFQRPEILYVEDQPEMVGLVRLALRQSGCEVFGALDGTEGLRLMRERKPTLVLLDVMLPGLDGWQVRDAMLADETLKKIPVVLVTARVPTGEVLQPRPLPPADAAVTKPFTLADLRSTVQQVLQKQSAPQQVM
jgi:CheY-like chemotaxis protein